MKKIADVDTYLFDDYFILSLSRDWLSKFKAVPQFEVLIDKHQRLHLVSKQAIIK